jgi:hypothetical protein
LSDKSLPTMGTNDFMLLTMHCELEESFLKSDLLLLLVSLSLFLLNCPQLPSVSRVRVIAHRVWVGDWMY